MTVFSHFHYDPVDPTPAPQPTPTEPEAPGLGLLAGLPGQWKGTGFNAIWRPSHSSQDRFLELNLTAETLDFDDQDLGSIPNRGFMQDDIAMTGVRYLQRISDANLDAGLHLEPGLWLNIPRTTAPAVVPSVARMASIPHGTTIVAQGTAITVDGPPVFTPVDLNPFVIGATSGANPFPEQNLSTPTEFRTSGAGLTGITQAMVDNPNSVLAAGVADKTISRTVVLQVTTGSQPIVGGGTANTAFLAGIPGAGPNADAALVTATFWLETVTAPEPATLLQYTQTVLLNFNGLSWPHVTVATLTKQPS
ncbi:heme-binding protein [uncultured Jatrophihabitans sp.]|uniref:heme-binding protein n=1 Tax=uncultured Jatrophihabitans sp. TaxID=1610747 RepID=UPI0035CC546E